MARRRRSRPAASTRSGATGRSGRQGLRAARAGRRVTRRSSSRHLAGEPLTAIARAMGLARGTVRKFARAESFPTRLPHGSGPSILDPYLSYRAQGFPGGNKQVHRWLAERRTAPGSTLASAAATGLAAGPAHRGPARSRCCRGFPRRAGRRGQGCHLSRASVHRPRARVQRQELVGGRRFGRA